MKNFWEIYENMREIVYVTDMDTDELVYINKFGREKLKIDSLDNVKGQPCYKVLQNCSSHCSICTNKHLKSGEFYEWKYYNGLMGKTFLLKDTMIEQDGKRYRLEISVDVSEMDEQKKTIKEFASNEALVNDALRLSLAEATPEKSIKVLLKHLGQSLRSDRVYIFEMMDNGNVKNTYEWCAMGVEPQKDLLQDVPFEVVSLWYDAFNRNENVVIKDLESIKETDPMVYETLLPQEVDSLVVSPLIIKGEIVGFYGVDNPPKDFLNHISVMFMVLGYFISSMIRRRNLVDRLEKLSYYDQLTGALNRHGMNEFVAKVNHDASIGIVYCDVMGLKNVNDTMGHLAGDALLVRAYECLSSIFPSEAVFRIGGDEFLAMSSNVTKEDMDEKIQALRGNMGNYEVNFAVGAVWQPKCNGQIQALLKEADYLMYSEKEQYYSKHPNDRRKR